MPDYIYLLDNRLSTDQQQALRQVREAAREAGMILFLTGDAIRDLTSGHAVRDLQVTVHGNALKLKKPLQKLGGKIWGEHEPSRSLYLCFPGTVRVDVISAHHISYPKPGKPVYHPTSILEDLRRRDFTVNAMAISLNEGSFGLLMDPLNGAADIETRTLRLVSNYGFLEEPALLIRATRYLTRLGWEFDAKTRTRYEDAKNEGVIEYLAADARSQELEQIGHEEDGLKVLRALEAEGWMKVMFPAWSSAKADEEKLNALHDLAVELMLQGVHADMSAAQMQLLTAKLPGKDVNALKKQMLRPGFVEEWNSLDAIAAGFAKTLLAKSNAAPSATYKLFTTYDPEAVLWLGFTSKDAAVKEKYNNFLKVWPGEKQNIPHALMHEMRITPELPTYKEIVHSIFLELIDGKLKTPEEMRAFLEPHSPPAPPPQITIKRTRARRNAEAKLKEVADEDDEAGVGLDADEDLDDIGADEDEIGLGLGLPKSAMEVDLSDEADAEDEDEEVEAALPSGKRGGHKAPALKPEKKAHPPAEAAATKKPEKPAPHPAPAAKPAVTAKAGAKAPAKEKVSAKSAPTPVAAAKQKAAPAKAKSAPAAKKAAPAPAKSASAAKKAKPAPAKSTKAAKPAATKAAAKTPAKAAKPHAAPAKGKPAAAARHKAAQSVRKAKPQKPAKKR